MMMMMMMCFCVVSPSHHHHPQQHHHRPRVTNVANTRNDREQWIDGLHSADVHCELLTLRLTIVTVP